MDEVIEIQSKDYWFKVVDMGQQNWALIDLLPSGSCSVFFIGGTSGIFDAILFESAEQASMALKRNGFSKYADDRQAQQFMCPPEPPFHRHIHPNGLIYSSGRYWR